MHLPRLVYNFLKYRLRAIKLHGIHSPFVYGLNENVISHSGAYYPYPLIEDRRQNLLQDNRKITVKDFGAGSKKNNQKTRAISKIARYAAKPPKYAQLLFRLVNHCQPKTILELGTSLGLTTAYLASANKNSNVTTFEGCPETAAIARETCRELALGNISVIEGNIDHTLAEVLAKSDKIDFVYFDGNHRYEPTLRYFKQCLEKAHEGSVFVLDDIYWSAEMERAWKEITAMSEVTVAIDLFQVGIVFFRKEQAKEYFTIRY